MIENRYGREAKYGNELPLQLPKVGLIGFSRTGKGLASETLKREFGFRSFPLSNVVREYAQQRGITLTRREDYWNTYLKLREQFGENYLLKRAMEELGRAYRDPQTNITGVIFDGIRTPGVAREIKELPNSLLIGIKALPEIRLLRARADRPEDNVTLEELLRYEELERESVNEALAQADVVIQNEGRREDFQSKIREVVANGFMIGI